MDADRLPGSIRILVITVCALLVLNAFGDGVGLFGVIVTLALVALVALRSEVARVILLALLAVIVVGGIGASFSQTTTFAPGKPLGVKIALVSLSSVGLVSLMWRPSREWTGGRRTPAVSS